MANLSKITYGVKQSANPNPTTEFSVSSAEFNQIKPVVNAIADQINNNSIDFKYKTFASYALMKTFLTSIGVTSDIYQICVLADEQNNSSNLTNYTYTNGTLNWVATTPISI